MKGKIEVCAASVVIAALFGMSEKQTEQARRRAMEDMGIDAHSDMAQSVYVTRRGGLLC